MSDNYKTSLQSRRRFLATAGAATAALSIPSALPAWARSAPATSLIGLRPLSGKTFDLTVSAAKTVIDGRLGHSVLVNNQLPAPLLRWREGDEITLRVRNELREDTSIHWHGILLPFYMDGVPGVTYPGIKPGETFEYRFPVVQSGTYWYHSHSGLQEQSGHYGPIVIDPIDPDPVAYDREYVIVLSDWTFEHPHRVFAKLKKMSDNYNFQQRTVGEFFRDVGDKGLAQTVEDRAMWGQMRMSPTDIADVTGATYTYLVNGHGPEDNWTGLFRPGERVRLRIINASAMSIFDVRVPGLPMTVVQADGLNVQPVETDEFQIGTAETFDVVVHPTEHKPYAFVAESNDRSGMAFGTLAPQIGMTARAPAKRVRPTLTMKDMAHGAHDGHSMHMAHPKEGSNQAEHKGNADVEHDASHGEMDHSAMGHGGTSHAGMSHGSMDHASMSHARMEDESMDHAVMGHSASMHDSMSKPQMGMGADMAPSPRTTQSTEIVRGPGVVNIAENPTNRLHERPLGLIDAPHRVLVYTDLKSLDPNPDTRPPEREIELHLTSNMERYIWSFDGLKFSEFDGPILFYKDERLRLTLINNTMMPHPIHLHGMFFEVVTGEHHHKPRKHTIVAKPGEKLSVDITADAVGDWAFHCHLLYHMHAGMMRVVSVVDKSKPG
ncbi:MAG: copper resistance system multicopper oxidase [Pseudomonadota bacterium]